MAELASLQIKVVRDGIEQAQKALSDLAKAADAAEKSTGKVGDSTEKSGKKTKSFADDISAAGKMIAGAYIARQLFDIGSASLQAAANMEQQRVAFTTMLGSAEKAKSLLSDMQAFAASTPFSFNEVVDAGKRLVAFGFDASTVVGNLRMLGDVAAGLSQPVGDMVYLFGQIKTQGRAMTQDLMQFANRGVPIYDELSKVLGVSTSQVKEYASQGKIGFKEIEQVFKNLTKEGGKFAGLMEAQSKTLAGQWSNFNDQLDQTAVLLGESISGDASEVLNILSLMVQAYKENLEVQKRLSEETEKMPSWLEITRKHLDGTYSKQNQLNELNFVQAKTYQKINEWQKGNVDLSQQELRWIKASITEREKEIALLNDKSFINTTQNDIEMQRVKTYQDSIKKNKPSETSGSGNKDWVNQLKWMRDLNVSGMSDIDQINAKYDSQLEKVYAIRNAAKVNGATWKETFTAEAEIIRQRSDAISKINEQLGTWESLGLSLKDSFKDIGINPTQAKVFGDLMTSLAQASISPLVDGFTQLGAALADGNASLKEMQNILGDVALSILKMLPMLFIQAGLSLMLPGPNQNIPLGLGLIASGIVASVSAGYAEGKRQQARETANAHGNVYGFSSGGSFANEVINSPTRFMFSSGGGMQRGLMGESGPEAIMPLKRMSNGDLGIRGNLSSGMTVNVYNYSTEEATVNESSGSDGSKIIDIIIGTVNNGISQGQLDKSLKGRYRLNPAGV